MCDSWCERENSNANKSSGGKWTGKIPTKIPNKRFPCSTTSTLHQECCCIKTCLFRFHHGDCESHYRMDQEWHGSCFWSRGQLWRSCSRVSFLFIVGAPRKIKFHTWLQCNNIIFYSILIFILFLFLIELLLMPKRLWMKLMGRTILIYFGERNDEREDLITFSLLILPWKRARVVTILPLNRRGIIVMKPWKKEGTCPEI